MIKNVARNLCNVANRKETIDFRTFCSGGSPEYVKAKQRLRDFHLKKELPRFNLGSSNTNIKAYSLYINPLAFFEPTFFLIGAAVVVVAILEKQLANHGLIFVASAISGILRIAFPVVAAGSFFYLLSHVNFL